MQRIQYDLLGSSTGFNGHDSWVYVAYIRICTRCTCDIALRNKNYSLDLHNRLSYSVLHIAQQQYQYSHILCNSVSCVTMTVMRVDAYLGGDRNVYAWYNIRYKSVNETREQCTVQCSAFLIFLICHPVHTSGAFAFRGVLLCFPHCMSFGRAFVSVPLL